MGNRVAPGQGTKPSDEKGGLSSWLLIIAGVILGAVYLATRNKNMSQDQHGNMQSSMSGNMSSMPSVGTPISDYEPLRTPQR
jgi:hypothetical protein